MSLINDALKRAQQAQPKRPPVQESDRPLQPATVSPVGSKGALVSLALVAIAGLVVGLWVKAPWRSSADETGRRALVSKPVSRIYVSAVAPPVAKALNGSGTKAETAAVPVQQTPPAPPPASPAPTQAKTGTHDLSVEGEFNVYIVRAGDTLTRIARRHGTTVKALRTLNEFRADRIAIGQKIRVPIAPSTHATAES